jgi:hypothetical protein
MRRTFATAVVVTALCGASGFTASASAWGIRSPSGNIECGDAGRAVVCIIFEQSIVRKRPCDGVYTVTAEVKRRGKSRRHKGCFGGRPFLGSGMRTLPYGKSAEYAGVSCSSSTRGIRCRNAAHHGFRLRRVALVLF